MHLPKAIFRSYDIRGIYPSELNEIYAEHIGKALGTLLRQKNLKNVVVGRDDRVSSPALQKHFISGLLATGCNVTDIGITLTPVIHFLTFSKKFDAGVNVTASHNPKDYNGFRLDYAQAQPLYGNDLQELYKLTNSEHYAVGKGALTQKDLAGTYINFIQKSFTLKKRPKVIIDCGSGATSIIAPRIFRELGCEIIPVYCNYDGNFSHGVPDPEDKLFMHDLSEKVREHSADIGFAFDTDGDRFGVVDEQGTIYDNDKLLLFFAEDILKKEKGTVVCDVKCSTVASDLVKAFGGAPKVIKTGHPFFVEEMKRGALLGIEFSGHAYFADKYFGYDDGIYAACRVLEILDNATFPLSVLMQKYPKRYHTAEVKIDCHDSQKFSIVEKIKNLVQEAPEFLNVLDIDGVKVQVSKTGWFLIRASNTSPYLSIRIEGETQKEISFLVQQVSELLRAFKLNTQNLRKAQVYFS